jgi:hypothetical protein
MHGAWLTGPSNWQTENCEGEPASILQTSLSRAGCAHFPGANLRNFRENFGEPDFSAKRPGLAGGGGSHQRTCLQGGFPCLAGKYRENLPLEHTNRNLTAPFISTFNALPSNSLTIRTGNFAD